MADLDRIRELIEAQTVECHSALEHDYGTCAAGCKAEYIPDPALAPLLEAVTEPCERNSDNHMDWMGMQPQRADGKQTYPCDSCRLAGYGKGRATRNVKNWPEGAVAGMLVSVAVDVFHWPMRITTNVMHSHTPDQAACEAIIAALETRQVATS